MFSCFKSSSSVDDKINPPSPESKAASEPEYKITELFFSPYQLGKIVAHENSKYFYSKGHMWETKNGRFESAEERAAGKLIDDAYDQDIHYYNSQTNEDKIIIHGCFRDFHYFVEQKYLVTLGHAFEKSDWNLTLWDVSDPLHPVKKLSFAYPSATENISAVLRDPLTIVPLNSDSFILMSYPSCIKYIFCWQYNFNHSDLQRSLHISMQGEKECFTSAALVANKNLIIASSLDNKVVKWNLDRLAPDQDAKFESLLLEQQEIYNLIKSNGEDIWQLKLLDDGERILAVSERSVSIYNLSNLQLIKKIELETKCHSSLIFGNYLIRRGHDDNLQIWDLDSGKKEYSIPTDLKVAGYSYAGYDSKTTLDRTTGDILFNSNDKVYKLEVKVLKDIAYNKSTHTRNSEMQITTNANSFFAGSPQARIVSQAEAINHRPNV